MNGNDHEERITRLEAARRELEDAFIVMTHLETKQSSVIQGLVERQGLIEAAEQRHRLRMAEFDEKLNALIDIVSRMQGGMETRPNG
jgi:hypothetical protein